MQATCLVCADLDENTASSHLYDVTALFTAEVAESAEESDLVSEIAMSVARLVVNRPPNSELLRPNFAS